MADADLVSARILLVIGGGVAAFKSLELIRRLRERGASVQAVLTPAAERFVTPLSVAALSAMPARQDLFNLTDEAEMGHIELSRSADLIVVAPATADFLAKMAQGLADDLASTALLATDKPVLVAPAMNVRMWTHPATRRNVARLIADGIAFVGPEEGEMACGEFGPGRMSEPAAIVAAVVDRLRPPARRLAGKHVLITAGPTHEPIDPVRFIGNRSSGLQGFALARAAARAGAQVTLVSGPVSLAKPDGVRLIAVETAVEMLAAVQSALPADVFIGAAAVADWRVEESGAQKLKKDGRGAPTLRLVENPDILATVANSPTARPRLVVGFAAETQQVIEHARQKLERKGCDLIVANAVGAGAGVFGGADNQVHIVTRDNILDWPKMSKDKVAQSLIEIIADRLEK
ncbi:MAG: bifunctional phosphopantothenoylcysteine decarboxylase/phosphopantothenate--cysteine ligase CoaBC [Pseudomonadota bacterium]|nr:bifunctional phosphopantothenoylcysteine decarboxylase/phosphopantothenate--cysteine ligase CoaBC [Pseudomonadota bacterium]